MRSTISAIFVFATCLGCTHLEPMSNVRLAPPTTMKNGVVLDVVFVRFPLGDPDVNEDAWQEIDELQLPAEKRRNLESNGLRVGVISGPLPIKLEQLMKMSDKPSVDEGPQRVDVDSTPPVKQRQLHVRGGRRTNVIVMGERQRRDELSLLMRTADDRVQGRTYRQVMGLFAARAFPKGDGGVSLEMTPELEHGDAQKRFTPGEGMFKVEFGPPHEVLDSLRWASYLAPGQFLAVSTFPKRPGTLGYHYFTEHDGTAEMQKMLLVRLARCEFDDRFEDGPVAGPADEQ
jgi:hypothetical protein